MRVRCQLCEPIHSIPQLIHLGWCSRHSRLSDGLGRCYEIPVIRMCTVVLTCCIVSMWASHPGTEPSCDCKVDVSLWLRPRNIYAIHFPNCTYRHGPHAWRVRLRETLWIV